MVLCIDPVKNCSGTIPGALAQFDFIIPNGTERIMAMVECLRIREGQGQGALHGDRRHRPGVAHRPTTGRRPAATS